MVQKVSNDLSVTSINDIHVYNYLYLNIAVTYTTGSFPHFLEVINHPLLSY